MFEVKPDEQPMVKPNIAINVPDEEEELPSYHEMDDDVSEHHEEEEINE